MVVRSDGDALGEKHTPAVVGEDRAMVGQDTPVDVVREQIKVGLQRRSALDRHSRPMGEIEDGVLRSDHESKLTFLRISRHAPVCLRSQLSHCPYELGGGNKLEERRGLEVQTPETVCIGIPPNDAPTVIEVPFELFFSGLDTRDTGQVKAFNIADPPGLRTVVVPDHTIHG